jgi:hypothetical protein
VIVAPPLVVVLDASKDISCGFPVREEVNAAIGRPLPTLIECGSTVFCPASSSALSTTV